MGFSYTLLTSTSGTEVFGARKVSFGTYTSSGGSTGGDIVTGLSRVDGIFLQPLSASVVANQPAINETLPLQSGSVTIVTTANETGNWFAIGE